MGSAIIGTGRYNGFMPSEKPTSRREFLRGRAVARSVLDTMQSLADRAAAALPSATTPAHGDGPPSTPAAPRLYASRQAMACEFAVEYQPGDAAAADGVLAALDLVEEIEAQLTIYRDASEVLTINRLAAQQPVEVDPRLFSLIEFCAWLFAETHGAFDITSGPLSRAWGFLRRQGRLPDEAEIHAARAAVGFDGVEFDPAARTIRLLTPGMEINFNAIGKGYALDRVAQLLDDRGADDYLCHGGQSSVLARGRERPGAAGGWRVGVPHPHRRDQLIGELVLSDEALGTSGSGTQFFEVSGRRFGHLIDPRTGWPAEGVHTASVVAATAAEADALSTAFYIMGPGETAQYCATHPDVAAVLVCPRQEHGDQFDVHTFNLDSRRWQPKARETS